MVGNKRWKSGENAKEELGVLTNRVNDGDERDDGGAGR